MTAVAATTCAARTRTRVVRSKRTSVIGLVLVAIGVAALVQAAPGSRLARATPDAPWAPAATPAAREQPTHDAYAKLPLSFVPNTGQLDRRVRYSAQAGGASFYFTRKAAVIALAKGKKSVALHLAFLGANPEPRIEGRQLGTGRVNYLIGNDPAKWRTNVPTYGQVVYRDLWPGIDMLFRGGAGRLKYEFLLRPGAKVADIRLAYRGARGLSVNRAGELLIQTPLGVLHDERPRSYQQIGGRRVPVASRFALGSGRRAYGFSVGSHDARQPLVIDPGLIYSTYLGGSAADEASAIAVDAAGSAYVTGDTTSTNFPTTPGAFATTRTGGNAVFVTKLDAAGTTLLYSTYLGGTGSNADHAGGISVDVAGSAYVTGQTIAPDFPTTPGAFATARNGGARDAFVTKLNPAGSGLLYSTYLGGTSTDIGHGIAVDAAGSAYVTGQTLSNNFPTTAGAFDASWNGSNDVFVTKLNPAGSAPLLYSTYVGGGSSDVGFGIAIDAAGNAYMTGETNSASFPTTAGAFATTRPGGENAFVTKLNPAGTAPLVYSTYLGGSGFDSGSGIAVDATGSAFVTGTTHSPAFPTMIAYQSSRSGGGDAFVTKVNMTGSALVYSTYLGGSATTSEQGHAIAIDAAGSAYVTGQTISSDFPTTAGAFDTSWNASNDAFVTKLHPAGSGLLYSTYLGGGSSDIGWGIAVDAESSVYATGETNSTNFPTTPGATGNQGGLDAFVTKLDAAGAPTALALSPPTATNPVGTSHTVTATVTDAAGQPVRNIIVRFTVTGSVTTSGSCTTGANGQCSFTYPGPTAPGADAISAYADTDGDEIQDVDEPTGAASKVWVAAAPATLVLTPAAATNPVGTDHTVSATVRDAFGNPTPGIVVRFSVTGAVATSGFCTTGANGQCSFTYPGPTAPGADAITAYADTDGDATQDAGEPTGAAEKTWTPGAPATLVLTPVADTNPVGSAHTVTATVRDAFGNPTPNIVVRFTITGPGATSGTCTTDPSGECTFTYPGPTAPGADAISAYADTDGDATQDAGEPTGAAEKTWVPAAPATLVLTPATATNTVGTSHTVTATVRDAFGNPTPGIAVRFTITGPGATSGTCTTGADGECDFTYAGPTASGTDAITAFADTNDDGDQGVGEPSGAATKIWAPGAPATLVLEPATATNPVGTSHTVTATVRDEFGNPTPGIDVRFTVTGSVATSGSCTTDAGGQCTFTYSGPTAPGADVISAYADTNGDGIQDTGEPTGAATKTWVAGAPATLVLTPAAATNPAGTTHTVTATVRDTFGNATPNIVVRFTVTGPGATTGQCTTAANGQCSFGYSSTQAGTDTITAYADTNADNTQDAGEPTGGATKTWTAPTPGCPAGGGDDDEDDDGLEDRDESLFGTLLGDRDSDDDGRRDGNDDSDDDGEDDEDEDDDSDDECPNDSDGDGEDDEDEDDDEDD
jgi:hypothetical protein